MHNKDKRLINKCWLVNAHMAYQSRDAIWPRDINLTIQRRYEFRKYRIESKDTYFCYLQERNIRERIYLRIQMIVYTILVTNEIFTFASMVGDADRIHQQRCLRHLAWQIVIKIDVERDNTISYWMEALWLFWSSLVVLASSGILRVARLTFQIRSRY